MNESLSFLPDVELVSDSLDDITNRMVDSYNQKYSEITGGSFSLSKPSTEYLILRACAVELLQIAMTAEHAVKMNLLKYSYGEYLDNLAALNGIARIDGTKAKTIVRFYIQEARTEAVQIESGTKVTTDNIDVYFETTEYAAISPGSLYVDIECSSTENGTMYNGISAGRINTLVNMSPYISSVSNITESSGGSDKETDDELAYRIYTYRKDTSVGTKTGYEYHVLNAYPKASDVYVYSEDECEVNIIIIGENGHKLTQLEKDAVEAYFEDPDNMAKVITDNVVVSNPDEVSYTIDLTYYIDASETDVAAVKSRVQKAIDDYAVKAKSSLGCSVDPYRIAAACYGAGAKKVVIRNPSQYQEVDKNEIAVLSTDATVVYGGTL